MRERERLREGGREREKEREIGKEREYVRYKRMRESVQM